MTAERKSSLSNTEAYVLLRSLTFQIHNLEIRKYPWIFWVPLDGFCVVLDSFWELLLFKILIPYNMNIASI